MAKTYFSNTPPSYTGTPISATLSNGSTVLDLPGDYDINVSKGYTKITTDNLYHEVQNNFEGNIGGDYLLDVGDNYTANIVGDYTTEITGETLIEGVGNVKIWTPRIELGTVDGSQDIAVYSKVITDILPKVDDDVALGSEALSWSYLWTQELDVKDETNVGNPFGYAYDPNNRFGMEWGQTEQESIDSRKEASAYFAGGVGIEKDLNVGGFIYGRVLISVTTTNIVITATNNNLEYYPIFALNTGNQFLYVDNQGIINGFRYNPFLGRLRTDRIIVVETDVADASQGALRVEGGASIGDNLWVANVNAATSADGSIRTDGGLSVEKNLWVNDDAYVENAVEADEVVPHANDDGNIGTTSTFWHEAYINNIYTKLIQSTTGTIQIKPKDPVTEIIGDIRVRGTNPIGTAPVVTNTLYVTVDGNDTNDGRAMDASRACRTIGGAMRSPYYQPGTQILVSAGFYLEDNPLRMKPYTSVRGSDIRTTFIEPINKTQDLFHVESGCYINYVTFLNGRSGLLEGDYAPGFNRGAYATAFPPLSGDDRIDLFHSPYIQNCTNQSGPWLRDGTMFVPNQTVQIPKAVGTGTWAANTTTIILTVSTGTLAPGMSINAGQQNSGFFDARTLMLANKPFMQEQVVAYVNQTFNTGTFTYNATKCKRDIGLIVDSIAIDMLYDSESDSRFAGLQYYAQGSVSFPGELTTTTQSLTYLGTLAASTASSASGDPNLGLIVTALFSTITNILTTSSALIGLSEQIEAHPNGLPSTTSTYQDAYDALLANKSSFASAVTTWINTNHPAHSYSTATCERDVGYIIDSVAFDLLHGGTKQSIKSGIYYYNYVSTATTTNDIPQTFAAYNYIKRLIPYIVTGEAVSTSTLYQNTVTQVTAVSIAGNYEAGQLKDKVDVITGIIRNGPNNVVRIPMDLRQVPSEEAENAYNAMQANKAFLQAEVTAFIDATAGTFEYSREKCYRDVGILVENIAYDITFGGNEKSVESGLGYYDGVISLIQGQETQTISAIDYLNDLCQQVITNTTVTDLLSGTGTAVQVINTALIGGAVASDSLQNAWNIVTDIIANGPSVAPAIYNSPGPDAAFVSAEILMQANRAFLQEDTINYVNNLVQTFPYSERKCRRDTKLIVDSIAQDLLYPTTNMSQSTFAGLQYWNQDNYTGDIEAQLQPTIEAMEYLKTLSSKVILNTTPADDFRIPYQFTLTQVTTITQATSYEVGIIENNFDIILEILGGTKFGWTDRIVPNSTASNILSTLNAYKILQQNKPYLAAEVIGFVNAVHPDFTYDESKCYRDVGLITDAICFDLKHSGNKQSIQAGLYYYGFSTSTSTIHGQETQTIAAYTRLSNIVDEILLNQTVAITTGNTVLQVISTSTATVAEVLEVQRAITTITNIIQNGPSVAGPPSNISLTATTTASVINAYNLLKANRDFIAEEIIAYVDFYFNVGSFNYNEEKCYRDVGLIIDAVSQDILLGGNQKSLEAGLSYWSAGYNSVAGQETTTTMALNYVRDQVLDIIKNTPVTAQTQTNLTQTINTFFQYGEEYGPQEAVQRNFNIITNIIENGPSVAPPVYAGGGLFSLTGLNGSDVKIAPTVVSVTTITTGSTYLIGLSTATVGFGVNSTLYIGDTEIFPYRDSEVDSLSFEYTGATSTWAIRKIDPVGSMGGSLVDGAVISDRSPIQSFVYDAFTQVNQGGRGVHIVNDGYAQLVSVFTIFCSTGVEVERGGIASIVNSNANFGNICLQAKGYGKRKFSGHIYNPTFKAYPESPDPSLAVTFPTSEYLDQYYPTGYWPNESRVRVFIPDPEDRPHISLVMEVVPPEQVRDFTGALIPQVNQLGFPGFLNATINTSTLSTGSITITGVDTEGVAVGNAVYIRDQFGSSTGSNGLLYAATGTVVTRVDYQKITISKGLPSGGGDPTIDEFFDIYICGNAYYTVLGSEAGDNPKYNRIGAEIPLGINILSTASTGILTSGTTQLAAHISAIGRLQTTVLQVIENSVVSVTTGNTSVQVLRPLVQGGGEAATFITERFTNILGIIQAANLTAAEAVITPAQRTKTGPAVAGAGSAITLIEANIEFLADEISAYVQDAFAFVPEVNYDDYKCQRDVKQILQRLIYDIETGGRYNCVYVGLSYWNRANTYYIVQLGENITRTDLFPDGSTINFYQRSYMSASGYVFEYVGAGIDYGSLPQRGVADPVQGKEVVMLDSGKVFFTSTDQNGDFRIGPQLVISQATGVLSGRTFTRSLFANMTPFILAIEGGQ
ncbi:MAG: hypothetical protein EBU90_09995 [Proteobacteria bacterium]|nr:hypothetical protein [Pseudomonadota bacterium]NBP14919.1 hypothetical protein [bacterium]